MKQLSGNIYNYKSRSFIKGSLIFDSVIREIIEDKAADGNQFIVPGIVDAHVHIESSMLTPVQFGHEAIKHGVLAVVADPHEIANVCGKEGVFYMLTEANKTMLKICTGVPSCVPATSFETSGGIFRPTEIEELFETNRFSHLSEMMNYPGVVSKNTVVSEILSIAKKHNKPIDGHAPGLSGEPLKQYIDAGISTDHECTSLDEALEKIQLGMKILLRWSSASNDFSALQTLVSTHPNDVMLCTDDCYPDDLRSGYLKNSILELLNIGASVEDIIQVSSVNPVLHYNIAMGLLQVNDPADFLVIDNINTYSVTETYIDGARVCDEHYQKSREQVNAFYKNQIDLETLKVPVVGKTLKAIRVIENSLFTESVDMGIDRSEGYITANTSIDLLKIVVLNRYQKAAPSIGFVIGFGLKKGAIATTVAHDSHNIIAVGVCDEDIQKAIIAIQKMQGGLVVVDGKHEHVLPLPVGGLMSNESCAVVADRYAGLLKVAYGLGSKVKSPFVSLSFLSLLVIPELKIGDRGLFDVSKFEFVNLQS